MAFNCIKQSLKDKPPKVSYVIILMLILITPTYALENSTIICIDNDTLQENITVYKDGNMSNLSISSYCQTGCDNISLSCSPPEYIANITAYVVAVLFLVGLYIVWRKL